MKGRKERENRTRCFAGLAGDGVDVGELDFEEGHAADFGDRDPGEDDDHGHLQGKLEEVGDEDSPKAADEGVDAGERD